MLSEPPPPISEEFDDDDDESDDSPEVVRLARERRLRRGLRAAARRALILARRYRFEEGPRGERELACVAQAMAWRTAARELRGKALAEMGPGLARAARINESQTGRRAASAS